VISPAVRINQI